jgi:protein TonB
LIYGLTSGLGKELVKKVQETVVVAIPVAPPPPPPPPPPEISEDQPAAKQKSQVKRPTAFVPKAEVQPHEAPPAAAITAVSEEGDSKKVEAEKPRAAEPAIEAPKKQPVLEKAKLLPGCKAPRYPAKSAEKEEEGQVVFRFLIALDGSVKQTVLVRSSGFERLDQAAKDAFTKCKFSPGKIDGESKETWVQQSFRWKLN